MRKLVLTLALIAGLAACTPAQIQNSINDYNGIVKPGLETYIALAHPKASVVAQIRHAEAAVTIALNAYQASATGSNGQKLIAALLAASQIAAIYVR